MHQTMEVGRAIEGLAVGVTTSVQASGAAKLRALHREAVATMPRAAEQEIRVLFARLEPVTVRAGEVFVEPPNLRMTGRNLDQAAPTTMVLFYVSDPGAPFADPAE